MILDADSDSTAGTPTDAPSVGPTMPPAFNLQEFARDSGKNRGLVLNPDTVLELVVDVSWSSANLDLVEMNVIRHIDGVMPLSLLESVVGISFDELHVMLAMLLARQLVVVVPAAPANHNGAFRVEPSSGVFKRPELGVDVDTTSLSRTG